MLSYRHSFHAGNYADVLKHIVLIEILSHMIKKDTAFDYIDTHSGAGLYDLHGEQGSKLREYQQGIAKLEPSQWPQLSRYFDILARHNPDGELRYYPGSPMITMDFLRGQDRSWLYELHPNDAKLLAKNMANSKRVRVMQQDGLKGLLSLIPPVSKRAVVLIDPSYEVKTDYRQVVDTLIAAHTKFPTGTYALWYPVVDRKLIDQIERRLVKSGIKKIQQFELAIAQDQYGSGMSASGMIVTNPPWTLKDTMDKLLPKLVKNLAKSEDGFYKSSDLVGE